MGIVGSTIRRLSRCIRLALGFLTRVRDVGAKGCIEDDGGATVTVRIKNTGSLAGDEVPQVYLEAPASKPAGVQFAPKTLVAFDRVTLGVGEEREVTLHVSPRAFEYWSVKQNKWVRAVGPRTILVGSSSRELPLRADL